MEDRLRAPQQGAEPPEGMRLTRYLRLPASQLPGMRLGGLRKVSEKALGSILQVHAPVRLQGNRS